MTERDIRALGLDQLTSGLARCAMAGQLIRLEAIQTLLSNVGEDTKTREAVIAACKRHPDARWWLLRKRKYASGELQTSTQPSKRQCSKDSEPMLMVWP